LLLIDIDTVMNAEGANSPVQLYESCGSELPISAQIIAGAASHAWKMPAEKKPPVDVTAKNAATRTSRATNESDLERNTADAIVLAMTSSV
jgi:hypothetical protein